VILADANAGTTCDTLAGPTGCGTHSGCTYKVTVTCRTLTCSVDYKVICDGGSYTCGKLQSVLASGDEEVCLTNCPCNCCISPGAGAGWSTVTGCNFDHGCN
jgi:hypothetical protein